MEDFVKNSSLRWYTEDVYANTPDELGVKLTEEEAQKLLEDFFDEHEEWLAQTINEAMRDYIFCRLTKK